ncbi:Proline iminopeptidase [Streptomyces sp. YIM 130001]|uniref:prolyl aminopeptidase n=1 Tax=Streptomyces sp. YIM 130001 TaxID=2259644 RepID=UPI000E651648|nr:prolyl aminopeptidase [Streptomyces sp. YIM 130001]RII09246.1 Proline iminopeptidase [Streptomyces sp. YIM 130001]
MTDRYPPTIPYDSGHLDTGDGNRVYYEQLGNPAGKPALQVHGGPGSGASRRPTQAWDPESYRVIRFDQRNCGRSTPHASDPTADMRLNTTQHLIDDMERLREHLGVERWLLNGGSWGSTLVLAYAQQHPQRVSEMVIPAVTTTSPGEIDWLYRGAGRFHPEAWDRFRDAVPEHDRAEGLLAAYSRLMENPDRKVRLNAATNWLAWEDAVVSGEPNGIPGMYSDRDVDARIALVRICSHYFSSNAWLAHDQLLHHAHELAGIPAVLVHGRHDMGSPVHTAWKLAKAWPGARLHIIEDSGHAGSEAMQRTTRAAIEAFKNR